MRLPRGRQHRVPQPTVRVDLLALRHRGPNRHVGELAAPMTCHQVGAARHRGMNCIMTQKQAEGRIRGVGGHAADRVAGVDVLQVQLHADLAKIGADGAAQIEADVLMQHIARRVHGARASHQRLPRSLRDDDHRMAALLQTGAQRGQQRIQREGRFGRQAEVDAAVGQRGVGGDEAAVTPHQLDQPHAVARADRLDVCAFDHLLRHRHRRLEAKALVDAGDVVVDGFGDAHHGNRQPAAGDLGGDGLGAAQRAVAPYREEQVDAVLDQCIDHDRRRLLPARGAQQRAAQRADALDPLRREQQRLVAQRQVQPLVAVAEAVDRLHAVVVGQAEHHGADDIVHARAEAAAGDDARAQVRAGLEEERTPRAGQFKGRWTLAPVQIGLDGSQAAVIEHLAVLRDELPRAHWAGKARLAQTFDGEVKISHGLCLSQEILSLA